MKPNFTIVAGDSLDVTLTIKGSNGMPVDITGATGVMTIAQQKQPTAEQIICQLPMTVVEPLVGLVKFSLEPENTADKNGVFPFDVQIVTSTGKKHTPFIGWVKIEADVTNNV